jgi:hypothetical protein
MKGALKLAAGAEALTGVALLIVPSLVVRLLFGQDPTGAGIPMARVTGIALIALGVGCGPGTPCLGMSIYGAGAAVVLAAVALTGGPGGVLLWPAVGRT